MNGNPAPPSLEVPAETGGIPENIERGFFKGDENRLIKMFDPVVEKVQEKTVLPVPDVPLINVLRPMGKPP